MGTNLPTLPRDVRVWSTQLEEAMVKWNYRREGDMVKETRAAGVEAIVLVGRILMAFEKYRDELFKQLTAYDQAARNNS